MSFVLQHEEDEMWAQLHLYRGGPTVADFENPWYSICNNQKNRMFQSYSSRKQIQLHLM